MGDPIVHCCCPLTAKEDNCQGAMTNYFELYKTEAYNPDSKHPMNMKLNVHTDSKVIKNVLSVHTYTPLSFSYRGRLNFLTLVSLAIIRLIHLQN